jgi:hypothetical protein
VPVAASDLVFYASASVPDEDSSSSGGAIDTLRRLDFTQIAANDTIEAVSDNAGDTMNLTVEGRDSQGRVVSETKALTGTSPISFSTLATAERVLKAELASAPTGSVTVRRTTGPTTIRVIPAGERGFLAAFRKDASDPSSTKDYYIKGFWKNTHGSLAALAATVKQNADPSAVITHALDASVNATTSTTNRLTTPGFTFNDSDKAVPGTDLAFGDRIGVWLKLSLAAGASPLKTTYTSEIAFQTV